MVSLFKKILPAKLTSNHDDDGNDYSYESSVDNMDYSFAIEYTGPPVTYDVPHVVPVEIGTIPVASVVFPNSTNNMDFPVVQPIRRTKKKIVSRMKICDSQDADVCCESLNDSPGTIKTPGLLRSSKSMDELHRFSGILNSSGDNAEGLMSSHASSSVTFSSKEEFFDSETPETIGEAPMVTFQEPGSGDIIEPVGSLGDFRSSSETDAERISINDSPMAKRNGKKGSCYRCFKGNRFTQKEVCLVCGAKYCSNCVLRAMGSMPEGRKCVTCVNYRIDELRRGELGKCSRMLKKMLTSLEIKQIMKSEVFCEANQIPADRVYVNDKPLCQEELHLLQSTRYPPKHLEPGDYWYDKVSGFWGKEGENPYQIITPELNVGGQIKRNASNGNTDVLINNREITIKELLMLQVAGVRCEKGTHFWVSAEGSYQEEGMNNVKGKIWEKRRTQIYCRVASLPIPKFVSEQDVTTGIPNFRPHGVKVDKLLLVGYCKSGTSTIFKQAKLLHNIPFSEDERKEMRLLIKNNLYNYLGVLLEGRERFEEESLIEKRNEPSSSDQVATVYTLGPRLKEFSDWLLNVVVSGKVEVTSLATTREYAELVEDLWNDPAIQATYHRRSEIPILPSAANYFLDKAIEISRTDYEPSDTDILYAEGIKLSNGVASVEFSFPKSAEESYLDPDSQHYQLIKLHLKHLGPNRKCLEMFEDIDIVICCISLSDYDEYYEDIDGVARNKMLESKQLFESIVTHPSLQNKNVLLILNKYDLLEEKIKQIPLTRCVWFSDFDPVISHNYNRGSSVHNMALAQRAFHYIAVKFKRLFHSLTGGCKLYVSMVTALELDSVDETLKYAREIVKWGDWEPTVLITDEITSYTNDESTL